jgi:hypothetical protein
MDIDWRSRAHDLESRLMWTGAAMDLALFYLKAGRLAEAQQTLEARIDYVRQALGLEQPSTKNAPGGDTGV